MSGTFVSVIIVIVAAIGAWVAFSRVSRDAIGLRSGLIWMGLWFTIGLVGLFPDLLNFVMSITQLQNRLMFALLCAILILFAIVFSQATKIESMERQIARMIRDQGLEKFRKTYSSKQNVE